MKELNKPPYTYQRKSGWYWEPRGRMAEIWPACGLGKDKREAFIKAWRLYNSGHEEIEAAKGPKKHTVAWGIVQWQDSDDYRIKASKALKKPNTIRGQDTNSAVIQERFGDIQIKTMTRPFAKKWYRKLREERGDHMAASVVRTARSLFQFFEDEGYRDDNPFRKLKVHAPPSTYVPWGQERVRAFFDAAAEDGSRRVGTFLLSVYEAAQNPSDVLVWKWDQIRNGGVYHGRGKTGQQAFVPLSSWLLSELDDLPKEAVQLFVNPATGRPYTYRYIAGEVRRIARLASIPDECQMRYLRHEAAQEAVDGGAEKGDVQSLLAHASPGTQEYYADRRDATEAQKARKLWKDE